MRLQKNIRKLTGLVAASALLFSASSAMATNYHINANLGVANVASNNNFAYGLGFGVTNSLLKTASWGVESNFHSYDSSDLNGLDFLGTIGLKMTPLISGTAKLGFNWLFDNGDNPIKPELAAELAYHFAPFFRLTGGFSHTFNYAGGINYFSAGLRYAF